MCLIRWNTGIAQSSSLVSGRKEGGAPVIDSAEGQSRTNGNKGRQIGILGAQPITDPGTHAGPNKVVAARMQLHNRTAVSRIGSMNRMQHAQIVHVSRQFWKQFTDP